MQAWPRPRTWLTALVLILIPVVCSLLFLYSNAPRNWSLHWVDPRTVVAAASNREFAAVTTPQGWDIAWVNVKGTLVLSRFDVSGRRLIADVSLRGAPSGSAQPLTLARAGNLDVVVWRQDTANGSSLRAALVALGVRPLYRVLAAGGYPLEHPDAFAFNGKVYVVFSWQRTAFDVYLSRIDAGGVVLPPVQLTHTYSYAYDPHAVVDAMGILHLVYLDACCNQQAFDLRHERFTLSGVTVGPSQTVAQVNIGGAGGGGNATPDRWALDVRRNGNAVWAAWSGDGGLSVAAWRGNRMIVGPALVVPGGNTSSLTLSVAGGRQELIWQQYFELGSDLSALQLDGQGVPTAIDRVAFEARLDDEPVAVAVDRQPAVLWQSLSAESTATGIELSHFTPVTLTAPSPWSKLGLGLANPLGNLALVLAGAAAVGVLLTVANVLLLLVMLAVYLVVFRRTPVVLNTVKWYAYAVVVAAILYAVFVNWGAPSPPLLFLSSLSGTAAMVAVGGMLLFVLVLTRTVLRRLDDVFRAALMAFAALYFIAFLQAIVLMQGQVAKI